MSHNLGNKKDTKVPKDTKVFLFFYQGDKGFNGLNTIWAAEVHNR